MTLYWSLHSVGKAKEIAGEINMESEFRYFNMNEPINKQKMQKKIFGINRFFKIVDNATLTFKRIF
jgi:hypothetical protein